MMINKIVISGGWGYGNIGDEAILKYTLSDLKKTFPGVNITVLSFDIKQTDFHHGENAKESIHRLFKNANEQSIKRRVLAILNNKEYPDYLSDYIEMFDSETLFIMAGGGYFNDLWMDSFYSRLCEICIANHRGAKTAIIGQTIGPIGNKKNVELFCHVANLVDYIDVRDMSSQRFLEGLLKQKEIHLSCDAVVRNGEEYTKKTMFKQIAVMYQRKRPYTTPHSTFFGYRLKQAMHIILGKSSRFEKKTCEMIKRIKSLYPDYRIVFVQSTKWNQNKILELKNNSGADGVVFEDSVNDYLDEISKSSLVISTNMHPTIIATSIGIPAIAISHTYKMDDYMDSILMKDFTFHNLDLQSIMDAIPELMLNQSVHNVLIERNRKLNEILSENYCRLKDQFSIV